MMAVRAEVRSGSKSATLGGEDTLVGDGATSRSAKFEPGSKIGRYIVLDRIGTGGMGIVLAATDPELERRVAIKVLRDIGTGEHAARRKARLLREAQAMAAVSHPNVVTVLDVGEVAGRVFIAMELVEGQTLRQWAAAAPRSWREIVAIHRDAGRGLCAVHAAGLVHRDFKPDNVLVGSDARVRVTDFGVVGIGGEASTAEPSDVSGAGTSELTHAGAILGTPAYMAPEQAAASVATTRSDQFSFCVAVYEALYGVPPYPGATLAQRATAWSERRMKRGRSNGPRRIRRILMRGLDPDPQRRWPSMEALLAALAPRFRVRTGLAAVGLVGITAVAVLAPQRERGRACGAADREAFAEQWNDEVRDRLRSKAQGASLELWGPVESGLDAWVARWLAARTASCDAALDPTLVDASVSCLRGGRRAFETLARLLEEGDRDTLLHAAEAVDALREPELCLDPSHGTDGGAPPHVSSELAARAEEVAEEAMTLSRVGRYEEAAELADAALGWVAATGLCGHAARLEMALARAEAAQKHPEQALALFERAYHSASSCGDLTVASAAASEVARRLATELARPHDAETWLGHARAAAERTGRDEVLAVVLKAQADVAFSRGAVAEAHEFYEQAWTVAGPDAGRQMFLSAAIQIGLGNALRELSRFEEADAAVRRGLALFEEASGPSHPDVAVALNSLGNLQATRGDLDEAAASYLRARAIWDGAGITDHRVSLSLANVARIRSVQGRYADALAAFDEALADVVGTFGDHPLTAQIRMQRARTLARLGRHEEAVSEGARARETLAQTRGESIDGLSVLAEIEFARGRIEQARQLTDDALRQCGAAEKCRGMALLVRGQLDAAEGRTAEAVRTLREAERLLPPGMRDYVRPLPEPTRSQLRGPE
jgi:tetratricopeptide (TPR) repeat protein